jgi:hypothetical protein
MISAFYCYDEGRQTMELKTKRIFTSILVLCGGVPTFATLVLALLPGIDALIKGLR